MLVNPQETLSSMIEFRSYNVDKQFWNSASLFSLPSQTPEEKERRKNSYHQKVNNKNDKHVPGFGNFPTQFSSDGSRNIYREDGAKKQVEEDPYSNRLTTEIINDRHINLQADWPNRSIQLHNGPRAQSPWMQVTEYPSSQLNSVHLQWIDQSNPTNFSCSIQVLYWQHLIQPIQQLRAGWNDSMQSPGEVGFPGPISGIDMTICRD